MTGNRLATTDEIKSVDRSILGPIDYEYLPNCVSSKNITLKEKII
jgi:hypothetical protein